MAAGQGGTETAEAVPEGFEAAYVSCRADALRLAWTVTGDRQLAEDIVSTVFLRLYRRWGETSIMSLRAYVRRSVANEIASTYRRLGRERRGAALRRPLVAPVDGPEVGLIESVELLAALAALPPRQRTAVLLRHYLDLPEAEAAARMGVAVGTVKSASARGLASLRARLEADAQRAA